MCENNIQKQSERNNYTSPENQPISTGNNVPAFIDKQQKIIDQREELKLDQTNSLKNYDNNNQSKY